MNEKRKAAVSDYIRNHIRQFREEAGMSQAELGEKIGKSNSNISDIERGRLEVSAADLATIADALNKPITYFYPFRARGVAAEDHELTGAEVRMISALRRIPYIALEDMLIQHVENLASWAEKDEFQRMAQELMRAGKILLEKD